MKKAGFPVKCGFQRRHRTEKPIAEIVPLLVCLNDLLITTTARQLRQIVFALLCGPDRITMLGISR